MTISNDIIKQNTSHWYIWLINKDIQYHKSINGPLKEFKKYINYNRNKYEIELLPKYTHQEYTSKTDITFCDIKFISKNGKLITECNDDFIHQDKSINICINEYKKIQNNIEIAFTFKILNGIPINNIESIFSNVLKEIKYENDYYYIKIAHNNPIISCYYYYFMRFHLEVNGIIKNYLSYSGTISELAKYYLTDNNTWYSNLAKVIYTSMGNRLETDYIEMEIRLPMLEEGSIIDNKLKLENIYDDLHLIIKETLYDYIFNKRFVRPFYIEANREPILIERRANIYSNPFNLLYYHLCIINIYTLDIKSELVKKRYNGLVFEINKLLLEKDINLQDSISNINNKLSSEVLINISIIRHFIRFFNIDSILEEYDNCDKEIICCNELLILFNKLQILINSGNNFESNIADISSEIKNSNLFKNKQYYKHKIILMFEQVIIHLSKYNKSKSLVCSLRKIYENYKLSISPSLNRVIYLCLEEAERIINEIDDDFMAPPYIFDLIKQVCEIYENIDYFDDLQDELYDVYTDLLNKLKDFKFDENFKQLLLQYDIIDALESDSEEVFINNLEEEKKDDIINEKENNYYYISSWLGL
jgi:hypothetical protein